MTEFRRARSNFALRRAVEWCREMDRPLLVLEALRCDYPWASDRMHRFVLEGVVAYAATLDGDEIAYYPYLEPAPGAGSGLLAAPPAFDLDAPVALRPRGIRAGGDPRAAVERGPGPAADRGPHPQLHAHALGQEDPPLERVADGGPRDHDRAQQPVRPRWMRPNSCSGILWCLGRYDRPWGPERPVFGKVRYMTCASARRKFAVGAYVQRYTGADRERLF